MSFEFPSNTNEDGVRLRFDSKVMKRLIEVSCYFRCLSGTVMVERQRGYASFSPAEYDIFDTVCDILFGEESISINSVDHLFQIYAVADKYDVPPVLASCRWILSVLLRLAENDRRIKYRVMNEIPKFLELARTLNDIRIKRIVESFLERNRKDNEDAVDRFIPLIMDRVAERKILLQEQEELLPEDCVTLHVHVIIKRPILEDDIERSFELPSDRNQDVRLPFDSVLAKRLIEVSPYFRAMSQAPMVERQRGYASFSPAEFEIFDTVCDILFGEQSISVHSVDHLIQIYSIADKYDIPPVVESCRDMLSVLMREAENDPIIMEEVMNEIPKFLELAATLRDFRLKEILKSFQESDNEIWENKVYGMMLSVLDAGAVQRDLDNEWMARMDHRLVREIKNSSFSLNTIGEKRFMEINREDFRRVLSVLHAAIYDLDIEEEGMEEIEYLLETAIRNSSFSLNTFGEILSVELNREVFRRLLSIVQAAKYDLDFKVMKEIKYILKSEIKNSYFSVGTIDKIRFNPKDFRRMLSALQRVAENSHHIEKKVKRKILKLLGIAGSYSDSRLKEIVERFLEGTCEDHDEDSRSMRSAAYHLETDWRLEDFDETYSYFTFARGGQSQEDEFRFYQ